MLYDPKNYLFTASLEAGWREIYREYTGVRDLLIDWFEPELYGEGWKVYGLYDFPHGKPLAENIRRCPNTARLIERHVPHHGAAGFSVLKPGTQIKPHVGYAGNFLRCHLGLSVPSGDCALRTANEVHNWQEGRVMVFDDRQEHSAWNLTDAERVVLLVDFVAETGGEHQ